MATDNAELLRQGFERFAATGQPPLELVDPDVELVNFTTFPITEPYRGHEGVQRWIDDIADPFDEFRYELVDVLAQDDEHVVATQRVTGRARTGGADLELEWPAVYWFRDGKVVRAQGFRDSDEALAAAGFFRYMTRASQRSDSP